MDNILPLLFFFAVIVLSAIMHEYAHGWMADRLGDPTARYAGRLTLNPIAHIDLFGTIILPFIMMLSAGLLFAYAKPVPFNPYNLKDQKWGPVWVAAAGPISNLIIAAVFGLIFVILPITNNVQFFISQAISRLGPSAGFQVIHNQFASFGIVDNLAVLCAIIVFANILLAVFNLAPIPPLDGSKFLLAVLPDSMQQFKINIQRYGMFILLFFIFFGMPIIGPIISFLTGLFTGGVTY